ncbi:MAG TPA: hypothetical protein PK402_03415 [Tepidisphaeraceae bacterium]|nr:hypothetical protein [Tepidisphaeraceae bacterium]
MSRQLNYQPTKPPTRLHHRATVRAFLALADQGVVSVATFLTGMLTARAAGTKDSIALYYLALTLWVVIGEVGNSLVSTPHMIRSPKLSGTRLHQFNGAMLMLQLILSVGLTLLVVIASIFAAMDGAHELAMMLLLTGLCAAPITLRNFARNFSFARHDTLGAFALDLGVSVLQLGLVALLYVNHQLTWWHALLIVGVANLVGAFAFLGALRDLFKIKRLRAVASIRKSWNDSKWLLASSLTWTAGTYLYPWVVLLISGRAEAAVWGVCFQLAAVGNPLVMAVQNFLGPQIAHAHNTHDTAGFRKYVLSATGLFALAILPVSIVMAVASPFLLPKLYGDQFIGNAETASTLVFAMLFTAISFGVSRGLFSLNRARLDLYANAFPIIVLVTVGVILVWQKGAAGAAMALLVGLGLACAFRTIAFLRISHRSRVKVALPIGGVV